MRKNKFYFFIHHRFVSLKLTCKDTTKLKIIENNLTLFQFSFNGFVILNE